MSNKVQVPWLRTYRKMAFLSAQDLARAADIPIRDLRRAELGGEIEEALAEELASHLRVNPHQLMEGGPSEKDLEAYLWLKAAYEAGLFKETSNYEPLDLNELIRRFQQ